MRKILLPALMIMTMVTGSFSQDKDDPVLALNGVYGETYIIRHDFSEGIASLNFERSFGKKKRATLRIGIYPDFESTVSFPITLTWVTNPSGKHHFEYGIGGVYRVEHFVSDYNPDKEWFYDVPAIMIPVMYRYQNKSGWFARGGINLFVSWPTLPSPSLSIGYRF